MTLFETLLIIIFSVYVLLPCLVSVGALLFVVSLALYMRWDIAKLGKKASKLSRKTGR